MNKYLLVATLLAISSTAFAKEPFADCLGDFANNTPPVIQEKNTRDLCFDSFAILYSTNTKTPIFSAEKLNRKRLLEARKQKRTNHFYEEARLRSAERATLADYKRSGFDRGHSAPAGDMPNENAMAQSFSLANMSPQTPENNRGAWNKIEQATRKYAMRAKGDVYVISGIVNNVKHCPIEQQIKDGYAPKKYDLKTCSIGNGVVVPAYYYKLVFDATTGRSWAYWIANTNSAPISKPISYDDLVKRTGIDFFPDLKKTSGS